MVNTHTINNPLRRYAPHRDWFRLVRLSFYLDMHPNPKATFSDDRSAHSMRGGVVMEMISRIEAAVLPSDSCCHESRGGSDHSG
jgi:hypothetical protein